VVIVSAFSVSGPKQYVMVIVNDVSRTVAIVSTAIVSFQQALNSGPVRIKGGRRLNPGGSDAAHYLLEEKASVVNTEIDYSLATCKVSAQILVRSHHLIVSRISHCIASHCIASHLHRSTNTTNQPFAQS
jgi:hypothetical protein